MKRNLLNPLLTITLCAALFAASTAPGQTDTNAPTPFQNPVTTVTTWLTSSDPALTNSFPSARGDLFAAGDYQNGLNVATELGVDLKLNTLYKKAPAGLALQSVTQNASVAGVVTQQKFDIAYLLNLGDCQIGPAVGGGYDFNKKKGLLEVGVDIKKMVSTHSFVILGVRLQSTTPQFRFGTGINF